jgi:hypothetical protein
VAWAIVGLTPSMNPLKRKLTDDNTNIPNKKISFIKKPPKKPPDKQTNDSW